METGWIVLCLAGVAAGYFLLVRPLLNRVRRSRLMKRPFPAEWSRIIEERVPLAACLSGPRRERLNGLIQVFLSEKVFEPCGGLEMSDEIRVTIAAQACLMLAGLNTIHPYPRLNTILVYPAAYSSRTAVRDGGILGPQSRAGESWDRGVVVLSWDHVYKGSADTRDGRNVVFHEFAHQLDQAHGPADGVPDLREWSAYAVWSQVLNAEYKRLLKVVKRRKRHVMDAYGATNPAEFFAVATETFFEKPDRMQREAPDLYHEMRACFQLDPAEWNGSAD